MTPVEKEDRSPTRIYHRTRTSVPTRVSGAGPGSDVRELGRRSLRDAVILLAKKLEALGVDVSDVTEMLGVRSQDDTSPRRSSFPDNDALNVVERNCLAHNGE
jgi:hypothetical protein